MPDLVIAHIRGRAALCRRLAKSVSDPEVAEALLRMAEECEADIVRLEPRAQDRVAARLLSRAEADRKRRARSGRSS